MASHAGQGPNIFSMPHMITVTAMTIITMRMMMERRGIIRMRAR